MKALMVVTASAALFAAGAAAKEIRPGDLRICGATHCRVVKDRGQAHAFSELLWGPSRVVRAPTPPVGSPIFQLRFRDGPAGAIISATCDPRPRPLLRTLSAREVVSAPRLAERRHGGAEAEAAQSLRSPLLLSVGGLDRHAAGWLR